MLKLYALDCAQIMLHRGKIIKSMILLSRQYADKAQINFPFRNKILNIVSCLRQEIIHAYKYLMNIFSEIVKKRECFFLIYGMKVTQVGAWI